MAYRSAHSNIYIISDLILRFKKFPLDNDFVLHIRNHNDPERAWSFTRINLSEFVDAGCVFCTASDNIFRIFNLEYGRSEIKSIVLQVRKARKIMDPGTIHLNV